MGRYPDSPPGVTLTQEAVRRAYWDAIVSTLINGKKAGRGASSLATVLKSTKGSVDQSLRSLRLLKLIPPSSGTSGTIHKSLIDCIPLEFIDGTESPDEISNETEEDVHGDRYSESGNEAQLATVVGRRVRNIDDLVAECKIDLETWQVDKWICNRWEGFSKLGKAGEEKLQTKEMYQVKAWLIRREARHVVTEIPDLMPVRVKLPTTPKTCPRASQRFQTCLVVPDIHCGFVRNPDTGALDPFHDRLAISVVLQIAQQIKPDVIVVVGDLLDLPDFQDKYIKSPNFHQTFQPSLIEGGYILAQLRQYTKRQVLIPGNHDDRIRKAVFTHLMHIHGIRPANQPDAAPITSWTHLLGLKQIDTELAGEYPTGTLWLNRTLELGHGERVGGKSGSTATKLLDENRASEGVGHVHRLETAYRTFRGHPDDGPTVIAAHAFGTLARLDGPIPPDSPRRNWQQGCGVIRFDENRHHADLVHIERGSAIFGDDLIVGVDYTDEMSKATGRTF